jgi:membrane dipeptidase
MMKAANGLVMVSVVPDFVSCRPSKGNALPEVWPPNLTLEHVVDHIVYIVDLIGADHVGLGSDFDGIFVTPRRTEDVSKRPDLVADMLRRGLNEIDVEKIVGKDLLRVWSEVDAVARKMQAEHKLLIQDRLSSLKIPSEPSKTT